eukprot:gene3180-15831_t
MFPYYDFTSGSATGYIPKFWDMIALEMGFSYEIVNTSLDMIQEHHSLKEGVVDVIVAGLDTSNVMPDAAEGVWFSTPIYQSETGALVYRTTFGSGLWRMFLPFSVHLWGVTVGCTFFLALVITFIDTLSSKQRDAMQALSVQGVASSVYHAWAFLIGGEDYEWL